MRLIITLSLIFSILSAAAQDKCIKGQIQFKDEMIPFAVITIKEFSKSTVSNSEGKFEFLSLDENQYTISIHAVGYKVQELVLPSQTGHSSYLPIELIPNNQVLGDLVISGTLKATSKMDSPIAVDVYSSTFFKRNSTSTLFDALQHINGVRPQINCNVCNTGSIHINGLDGPYTMVLINGMPIVSGLATVYGLSGIPQSLIERIEVIKGPSSTLYGSEALGGVINIITKNPKKAARFNLITSVNSWQEKNNDISVSAPINRRVHTLMGINSYRYQNPIDNNGDGFTDLSLQNRISVFNSWQFTHGKKGKTQVSGRYIFEDRWGGEMNWQPKFAGGDSIYGEWIKTKRWEVFGSSELPLNEEVSVQWSFNNHNQKSYYGLVMFDGEQRNTFAQITWRKCISANDILIGLTYRLNTYNDNTLTTTIKKTIAQLPGAFIQDQIKLNKSNTLLLGTRLDISPIHGRILSPRINYRWISADASSSLRIGAGNGYRVVNVFTEDHAALSGARETIFLDELKPETSWSSNLNFTRNHISKNNSYHNIDINLFYTHFNNRIQADYITNPNAIIYKNLDGYSISRGFAVQCNSTFKNGISSLLGFTLQDVFFVEKNQKTVPLFTEKLNFTWSVGYNLTKFGLTIDYTGNLYSPMKLPVLGPLDPRSSKSPWWSLQNIQITKSISQKCEVIFGVKNLLNWTPNKRNPFIIARAFDPFDKNVEFDSEGNAIANHKNPYGLTFDPTYAYGPNQGINFRLDLKFNIQ